MPDRIADHVLGLILRELTGVLPVGSIGLSSSFSYRPGGPILIRTPAGVVELTARTLPAGDPAAVRIEESIRAIDSGDVE